MPQSNGGVTNTYLEKGDKIMMNNPDEFGNILSDDLFNRSLTRVQLQALITASALIIGQKYTITDAVSSTLVLVCSGVSTSEISELAVDSATGDIYNYDITTDLADFKLKIDANYLALFFEGYLLLNNFKGTGADGENIFLGRSAGNETMQPSLGGISSESSYNTGLGVLALKALTSGWSNVGVGYQALTDNTTGKYNTAGGVHALGRNIASDRNTAFGHYAGYENISGAENVYIGASTGRNNTSGSFNTLGGVESGYLGNGGSYNASFGYKSLRSANSSYNSAFGSSTLTSLTTGQENSALGIESFRNLITGSKNTGLGANSGQNNNGSRNVFIGYESGYYETGSDKLFIDNRQRANESDARLKSLIYGIFDDVVANQRLFFNGYTTFNNGVANQNVYVSGSKIGISRTSDGAEVVYFSKNSDLGDGTGTTNIHGYNGIQFRTQGAETVKMTIKENGVFNFASMPTSASGLSSGDIWSDSGIIKIIA